ncbi:hypothetical protein F5884DRAFT_765160 [Xylogone sp. PMI_703]|nr:hypothetical protein F5884DRAFT_765160 [Xylogone sp. PMI_703]
MYLPCPWMSIYCCTVIIPRCTCTWLAEQRKGSTNTTAWMRRELPVLPRCCTKFAGGQGWDPSGRRVGGRYNSGLVRLYIVVQSIGQRLIDAVFRLKRTDDGACSERTGGKRERSVTGTVQSARY